jgi:DNA-binding GntR family transcriptional regulator
MNSSQTSPIPGTRAAAVEAELRRLILSGELPVGTRLRQAEIAERLGVSTTPVREAFTTLSREGLVLQDAHRGARVVLPAQDDVRENYEVRELLEPLAAEHATGLITAADLAALQVQHERMQAGLKIGGAQTPEGSAERRDANREFHRIIYDAAQRPRLGSLIEQLRNSAEVFISILAVGPLADYHEQANDEHAAIIASLTAGDKRGAASVMRKHLHHNYVAISKTLGNLAGGQD